MSGHRGRPEDLWNLFPGSDHYSVRFSIVAACTTPRIEPEQYTETIQGEVLKVAEDGSDERIGTFEGYRLRRDLAAEEGVSFFDIADAFSTEACDYILEVFDEYGAVRPGVAKVLGEEPRWGPVLMAHKLQLDAAHRGRGLGYAIVNSFIETFEPGVGLAIARAAPIDPPDIPLSHTDTPEYQQRRARGVRALRAYWQTFGFVPIGPDSEFLAINLALTRPSLIQAIRDWRSKEHRQTGRLRRSKKIDPNAGGAR